MASSGNSSAAAVALTYLHWRARLVRRGALDTVAATGEDQGDRETRYRLDEYKVPYWNLGSPAF